MNNIPTYLDSGILLAAHHGESARATKARAVLRDTGRSFISSDFVMLETVPKAVYHRQVVEEQLYRTYLQNSQFVPLSPQLVALAVQIACQLGLSALDAFHLAAAQQAGAVEFITTEKPTKPLFRATALRVVHLMDL